MRVTVAAEPAVPQWTGIPEMPVIPAEHSAEWITMFDALARTTTATAVFETVDAARRQLIGAGLLTISRFDAERSCLTRIWSSNLAAYPVGGSKDKADTPWTRQVLQRGEVFIGEGAVALAAAFDDHPRIASLGLNSIINVPLLSRGHCVGTFNLLSICSAWTQQQIAIVRLLALAALPAVLTS